MTPNIGVRSGAKQKQPELRLQDKMAECGINVFFYQKLGGETHRVK